MNLKDRADKVLSPVLGRYFADFEVASGKGSYLIGTDGKKYLDFATGIAVISVGHCNKAVTKAIIDQAKKLVHVCAGIAYYEPNIALAEKLQKIAPMKDSMTWFCQSGGEAIEASLKLARYVTKKPGLAALEGGFHGRSFGAMSITSSKDLYRKDYAPFLPDTYIVEKRLDKVEEAFRGGKMAGIVVEPVMGEGGYFVQDKDFMVGLRQLCDKYGVLLIADEVQTGIGRTGKWFGIEHFGIEPDVIALAKGIANGMPLGACIAKAELMKKWDKSTHGGTLTGNPVCCAAGLATLAEIEKNNLLENAASLGDYMQKKLKKLMKKYPVIKDVRGLGLMIGVELDSPETVKAIRNKCLENGLVLISCGPHDNVIRLVPPLSVKKGEVDKALKTINQALGSV